MSKLKAARESKDFTEPTIIISINNIGESTEFADNFNIKGILHLEFDDMEKNEPGCMRKEDADGIYEFINEHFDVDNIVVHCTAGVSRSAGVAAALMFIFNNDDSKIFCSHRYCPNMYCYRMTLTAFGLGFESAFFAEKEDKNKSIWFAARDD